MYAVERRSLGTDSLLGTYTRAAALGAKFKSVRLVRLWFSLEKEKIKNVAQLVTLPAFGK